MGFYITQSYVTNDLITCPDSPESEFSGIVNIIFKDDVSSRSWKQVIGAKDCFYAVKANRFTENWFFIVTVRIGNCDFAKLATKITLLKHGNLWIHQNENSGIPDAIFRGERKVVSLREYVSV